MIQLSPLEEKVKNARDSGLSIGKIASTLGVSIITVKNAIQRVRYKLMNKNTASKPKTEFIRKRRKKDHDERSERREARRKAGIIIEQLRRANCRCEKCQVLLKLMLAVSFPIRMLVWETEGGKPDESTFDCQTL